MRISELESAAANFRRERQAYNRMERDLRRERDAARELLTETVRSIVLAQCLPNDLPYFAFYFNRHLPRLTQQEQANITRFASPGLLRMRETMRALQESNIDLRLANQGLRQANESLDRVITDLRGDLHALNVAYRRRAVPNYTDRLEGLLADIRHATMPRDSGSSAEDIVERVRSLADIVQQLEAPHDSDDSM